MKPRTIAVLNMSETSSDLRVRRICSALAQAGHRVTAINPDSGAASPVDPNWGFEIKRVPPAGRIDRQKLATLLTKQPELEDLLTKCDPVVANGRDKPTAERLVRRAIPALLRRAREAFGQTPRFGHRYPDPVLELYEIRNLIATNVNLFRAALGCSPDIVHVNDLNALIAGYLVKRVRKIALAYDAHEIFEEQFPENCTTPLWHGFYTDLERALLPHTDFRMTVCRSLGRYFEETFSSEPFVTVHNVPSREFLPKEPVARQRSSPELLYHGVYVPFRGLEAAIDAAKLLPNVQLTFRGFGPLEVLLRRRTQKAGLDQRVRFAEPVLPEMLISAATESDIGINPFPVLCTNTEFALPNKFFEYMMAGLAIVSSDLTEMRTITDELEIGRVHRPADPEAIAETVEKLTAEPSYLEACRRRAWQAARDHYNWDEARTAFLGAYESALG